MYLRKIRFYFVSICMLLLATSCARDLSSNVYTSDSTMSLTMEGKIISVRPIKIKNTDKLSDNTVGTVAGGATGAAIGTGVGAGSGRTTAVIGGAIVGGVAGALVESKLGEASGYEYVIKVETKNLKDRQYGAPRSIRQAVASAMASGLITVVQGDDVVLKKGDEVFVIVSEKRARIIEK